MQQSVDEETKAKNEQTRQRKLIEGQVGDLESALEGKEKQAADQAKSIKKIQAPVEGTLVNYYLSNILFIAWQLPVTIGDNWIVQWWTKVAWWTAWSCHKGWEESKWSTTRNWGDPRPTGAGKPCIDFYRVTIIIYNHYLLLYVHMYKCAHTHRCKDHWRQLKLNAMINLIVSVNWQPRTPPFKQPKGRAEQQYSTLQVSVVCVLVIKPVWASGFLKLLLSVNVCVRVCLSVCVSTPEATIN